MTVDHRLMSEVAGQGGFADAVRADQHGVGCVLEEVEAHQRLESSPVDRRGPVPVEVAQRVEAADMGALKATLDAAPGAVVLFPAARGARPHACAISRAQPARTVVT